ncbi:MAG: fatty acid--CoA ligase family protein, partial [Melioribacteraceae bacterium]|nr:fatty acid--CoA ligase family protein [Melioribacteraceae bacterium]
PGVKIEIHDEHDKVVNEGITGEICARGENIMLGYWNDPESTKQVIKNGWLHTGDLAHIDSDGFIYIDGRSSDMIKSGANRISPKEIEEVIAELKEVLEVAVVGVPDNILGQIIKAVIVLRPGKNLDMRDVKAYCKKNLADYKVPKRIDFIDAIPKTASGKIQRYKLQEQYKKR